MLIYRYMLTGKAITKPSQECHKMHTVTISSSTKEETGRTYQPQHMRQLTSRTPQLNK